MEAYSLRTELEVQDVIDYIDSTKTAFPSYLDFLSEKTKRGYGLSDATLNAMRSYLEDLINQGENYYLKDIMFEKIDAVNKDMLIELGYNFISKRTDRSGKFTMNTCNLCYLLSCLYNFW